MQPVVTQKKLSQKYCRRGHFSTFPMWLLRTRYINAPRYHQRHRHRPVLFLGRCGQGCRTSGSLLSSLKKLERCLFFHSSSSGEAQNCRVKKIRFRILIFFVWVVNLVQIFKVPCSNNFLFWHYCHFRTRTKIQFSIWHTGDNFVLPWQVCAWLLDPPVLAFSLS